MDERARRRERLRRRRRKQLIRRMIVTGALMILIIIVLAFSCGKKEDEKPEDPKPNTEQNDTSNEDENKDTEPEVPKTLISFDVALNQVTAGTSKDRIEFSHGPASGQTVHHTVKTSQETLLSKYNAYAVDLETPAEDKVLYMTFDCGYEYKDRTAGCLDVLKEKNVPAAFYLVGDFAKSEPALTQRMIDEGHVVGNHSDGHEDFAEVDDATILNEVQTFHQYMKDNFNYEMTTFRFPSGTYSEHSLALISSFGYKTYFWSCAYSDWDRDNGKGSAAALELMKERLHPGAYILLHCVSPDEPQLLADLIDYARSEGYTFMPIPE